MTTPKIDPELLVFIDGVAAGYARHPAIDRLEDGLDPSLAAAMRRENEGRE